MHTDLERKSVARRLRAAGEPPDDAPYDWAEFQRRRQRSLLTRAIERHRPAAIAAAILAAILVCAAPFVRPTHERGPAIASRVTAARAVSGGQEQARTRAIEAWLAGLPRERVLVRVGAHAAVSGLQDQIAALDDLMSAERAAGARPGRLAALQRQRGQLVSSLAQLRYAEMLASATP